jgi:hypothetical protein
VGVTHQIIPKKVVFQNIRDEDPGTLLASLQGKQVHPKMYCSVHPVIFDLVDCHPIFEMGDSARELPVQMNYLAMEHYLSKLNSTLTAVNKICLKFTRRYQWVAYICLYRLLVDVE